MSAHDNGGPAFPSSITAGPAGDLYDTSDFGCEGMTLRDYFAAKALASVPTQTAYNMRAKESHESYVARRAYEMADAMLKERAS